MTVAEARQARTLDYLGLYYDPAEESPPGAIDLPDLGRNNLADIFHALGFHRGVEVGVERGKYSEVLLDRNPHLTLVSIDPWQVYGTYRPHVTQGQLDGLYADTQRRLERFSSRSEVIRGFSADIAAKWGRDFPVDFVYLDGAHDLASVIADIAAWEPHVVSGGIIAGHDYRHRNSGDPIHVQHAVQAWTSAYQVWPWFVLTGDTAPTWLWVKP